MNIVKKTTATKSVSFAVALFLGTALTGAAPSYAGFQVGQASAPSAPQQMAVQNSSAQMDGTTAEPPTKSFQIFNERYVPDSVRKKYNLDDSWFGKDGAPVTVVSPNDTTYNDPTPIAPSIMDATPASAQPTSPAEPVTMRAQPQVPADVAKEVKAPVESWRGRKGENIHDVMQRWAERAGTQLMWASEDAPTLQKDFTFVGKFQDAINALISKEGGSKIHSQYRSEGLNPVMMSPASTVTTNSAPVSPEVALAEAKEEENKNPLAQVFQPKEIKADKPETRWFALSGAPLAEVVRVWAEDAGVAVIWQSEKNFAVKESISQVGYFEDAVFKALDQYSNEDIRPVGEMYRDPQSGQLVLLVRTDVKR